MATHEPSHPDNRKETGEFTPAPAPQKAPRRRRTPDVTEARSQAQRAKLDTQAQARQQQAKGNMTGAVLYLALEDNARRLQTRSKQLLTSTTRHSFRALLTPVEQGRRGLLGILFI